MTDLQIPKYTTRFSVKNRIYRLAWNIVYIILFRTFPGAIFRNWRNLILRIFGARIGHHCIIYANAKIWMPCNLNMGNRCCIGPKVFIYNPSIVNIGNKVTISQNSYICGGSHNIKDLALGFISKPIIIKDFVWICANCFIMMGITIKTGCVIGATASLFSNTEEWSVYGGNPAKLIKKRIITNNQ